MNLDAHDRNCRREQRIIWLILHYPLWGHLPVPPMEPWRESYDWRRQYSRPIVKAMQEDGVLSEKTTWDCINLSAHIVDALAILNAEDLGSSL